jgi:hypothetical protein
LIFILASGVQHDCHAYLASLKKYSVPEHPVFNRLVCPHYFVECLIYLAISIVAAPAGAMLNWTIVCALIFVAVNLGVTADGTREWYVQKFGPDSVMGGLVFGCKERSKSCSGWSPGSSTFDDHCDVLFAVGQSGGHLSC